MWMDNEVENGFDTAQICLNGHTINVCSVRSPEYNQKYCDVCGAATIIACQECSSAIRGLPMNTQFLGGGSGRDTKPPSCCHECGEPYPWVKSRLEAARELANELDGLGEEDKSLLQRSLDDIVRDTPRTALAATRFKRLVAKAGHGAAECFKQVLSSVAAEAAKKQIWG